MRTGLGIDQFDIKALIDRRRHLADHKRMGRHRIIGDHFASDPGNAQAISTVRGQVQIDNRIR